MIKQKVRTWVFYTKDKEGRTCIFNERDCKFPKRTKDWKELLVKLEETKHLIAIGIVLKERLTLN